MRILYVEDMPVNLRLMKRIALHFGHELTIAVNGAEAMSLLQSLLQNSTISQQPAPDIILMDISLPDIDGLVLTAQIRELFPDLPIIAITAYAMAGDRERCLEAGCTDYIAKPFKMETIGELLDRYSVTTD